MGSAPALVHDGVSVVEEEAAEVGEGVGASFGGGAGAGGFVVGGLGGAQRGADHVAGSGDEGAFELGAALEGLRRV